ncbi:MAG: hypothetical protein V3S98_01070, partial [Dehalococcoidia bacterium]
MASESSLRLPSGVKPDRYSITLTPNLTRFTFEGQESIDLSVLEPTEVVELHSAELDIQSASVTLADGSVIDATVSLDADHERASIRLAREVPAGKAR